MSGYAKLFGSVLASTVWREDHATRIVWVTMLVMKDADGLVEASIPGLADLARVSLDECERALQRLSEPDKYSRSKREDGRRIRAVDGGWIVINHDTYRDKHTADEIREKARLRKAEYRRRRDEKKVSQMSRSVPHGPKMSRHTDTDTYTDTDKADQDLASYQDPAKGNRVASNAHRARANETALAPLSRSFQVFWNAYPKKAKRADVEFVWQSMNPSDAMVADMLNALAWQTQSPAWKDQGGRFIPNARDWLLDRRWEERPPKDPSDEAFERVMRGEGILR